MTNKHESEAKFDEAAIQRFLSHTKRSTEHQVNGVYCLDWTGSRNKFGYPKMGLPKIRATTGAHRVAFFLANGRWPEPFCCHHCDRRLCVEASHLFSGTREDNTLDMVSKGRQAAGERGGMAKLLNNDVALMKNFYSTGQFRQKDIADAFGIHQSQLSRIMNGEAWKTVTFIEGQPVSKFDSSKLIPYTGDKQFGPSSITKRTRRLERLTPLEVP